MKLFHLKLMQNERQKQIRRYVKNIPVMLEKKKQLEQARENHLYNECKRHIVKMHLLVARKDEMEKVDYNKSLARLNKEVKNLEVRIKQIC